MTKVTVKFFIFFLSWSWFALFSLTAQQLWTAPSEADKLENPFSYDDVKIIEQGKKIFQSVCAACHGKTGKGDVPSMQSLNPKPADLTSETVQNQTDGAIFWKITEGRGLMASYKDMLSDKERWALVVYIRSLAPKKQPEKISKEESLKIQPVLDTVKEERKIDLQRKNQQKNIISADSITDTVVSFEAFPFTMLANIQTTRVLRSGFGFIIQHRFGAVKFDEGLWRNFLGLDLASNIRFAFEVPLGNKANLVLGRTRYGKLYDFGIKYALWLQNDNGTRPFGLTVYSNVAVNTEKTPAYSEQSVFLDGRPFEFKWYHRLSYDTQILVSRKFNKTFSAQVGLEFIWRNLVPPYIIVRHNGQQVENSNAVLAFPVILRLRTGYKSAVNLEIIPNTRKTTMPFALAYEIASSGNHVFQITLGNSERILPQMLLTRSTYRPGKEGLLFGFNLIRYF